MPFLRVEPVAQEGDAPLAVALVEAAPPGEVLQRGGLAVAEVLARKKQQERLAGTGITCNAKMTPELAKLYCNPTPKAMVMLEQAFEKLDLSARAYDKVLKVARTIADLEDSEAIEASHIAQAVQFRSLDRKFRRE